MTRSTRPTAGGAEAAIARITLDEPERRNALTPELIGQLAEHLAAAAADASVRAVILDHAGGTFCSGADLDAAREVGMTAAAGGFLDLLRAIVDCPRPVIAVVDGHVRAGGLGLIGACDAVFASPGSDFAAPESRIGVAPAMIALTVLPRMVPRAAAAKLLTGCVFDTVAAAQCGLVTTVADDPAAAAAAFTAKLLRCSPQGLAETKALLTHEIRAAFDARGAGLAETSARLFATEEAREGMAAVLGRRAPAWAPPPRDG
ncbi:enoyl-CoA hydratase [Corynebacterium sphenisci DSM 44792]|uniref:Enoyl-CoA hydratase n=2 Tax=Corynebacterium sphenisci TaxID=191493 RepID=A0A1L7CWP2_9CORY|nr:enoyl-CoA hydratase [Corynebacterium sphenisci DSM 44792]